MLWSTVPALLLLCVFDAGVIAKIVPKSGTCLPTLKNSYDWTKWQARFTSPGAGWQGLILGNGRMGVKVMGTVDTEVYQLNDNTFWSGDPQLQLQFNNGTGPQTSISTTNAAVRLSAYHDTQTAMIAAYKQGTSTADQIAAMAKADKAALKMWGPFETTSTFLPLGNLNVQVQGSAGYTNYSRTLDMDGGKTVVAYTVGKTTFYRESFVSYPDNIFASRFYTSDGSTITAKVNLTLPSEMVAAVYETGGAVTENSITVNATARQVVLKARAPYYKSGSGKGTDLWSKTRGITAEARVGVQVNGGSSTPGSNFISVSSPDFTLYYRSSTSYVDPFTDPSGSKAAKPSTVVAPAVVAAQAKGYSALLTAHQTDFRAQFRRFWMNLGGKDITAISGGTALTPSAYAMHYMYTRFQLLSASRSGTSDRPNALQGIWSSLWTPQNQGSYFFNENVEKMYAAMEMQNIPDSGDPLWKYLANLAKNGQKSAANDFGYTDASWSTAHYSDIWVATTLRGGGTPTATSSNEYVIWPFGGIWTMNQIYDHYSYSLDTAFLNQYYPVIEGAARFALNSLGQVDGLKGELKTYLSIIVGTSPEHTFNASGNTHAIDVNPACEIELFNNIFQIIIDGSAALAAGGYSVNTTFVSAVKTAKAKLMPLEKMIASWGSLKEYYTFNGTQPHHRHASHLLTVFPLHYTGFSKTLTPALYKAAQGAYVDRGGASNAWHPDGTTGGVRLGMASQALTNPKHGLFKTWGSDYWQWGAIGACVGEAILDSTNGEIEILPFLPSEWSSGTVVGARARGNYELSIVWAAGKLVSCQIDSHSGTTPTVKYDGATVDLATDTRFTLVMC